KQPFRIRGRARREMHTALAGDVLGRDDELTASEQAMRTESQQHDEEGKDQQGCPGGVQEKIAVGGKDADKHAGSQRAADVANAEMTSTSASLSVNATPPRPKSTLGMRSGMESSGTPTPWCTFAGAM